MQAEVIKFDEFELDLGRYELRRQGQPLKLKTILLELLILLDDRPGQLVARGGRISTVSQRTLMRSAYGCTGVLWRRSMSAGS